MGYWVRRHPFCPGSARATRDRAGVLTYSLLFFCTEQVGYQQNADRRELARERVEQLEVQIVVRGEFRDPFVLFGRHHRIELRFGEIDAAPIEIFISRHPAERSFDRDGATVDAVDNPFEDAKVIAEARPEKLAILATAEPVDVEHPRRARQPSAEFQPVIEVVAHVVAAER